MAQLPPDGEWLVQQVGDEVILFQRYTEEEIAKWQAGDQNSIGPALKVISESDRLDTEQKSYAMFWAGYFYAHAKMS
jgi:hypothetical protein